MALRQLHSGTIADVLLSPGAEFTTYWNNPPLEVVSVFIIASVEVATGGNWCDMRLLESYEQFFSAPEPKRRLVVRFKNMGGAKGWATVKMYWATA